MLGTAQVGKAAPVVGALVTGAAGKEAAVSEQFGGDAGATSIVDPLFMSVGQVRLLCGPACLVLWPAASSAVLSPSAPRRHQLACHREQVLNYSGLGVRDEALATPEASQLALAAIEDLLGKVPADILSAAREKRAAGRT
jgi:hypothetical protein